MNQQQLDALRKALIALNQCIQEMGDTVYFSKPELFERTETTITQAIALLKLEEPKQAPTPANV